MNIYEPTLIDSKEEEDALWQNATIVFDTSALCSLYDLTDHYRLTMVSILSSLKDRILIPYHVKEEYLRNRKKAIINPIVEKYRLPEVTNSHFVKAVRECIKQWETNKYYHPYIDSDKLKGLKNEVEEANKHIRVIKDLIRNQYGSRIAEIKKIAENDFLLELVNSFKTGSPYSYKTILEIMREGDFRYRNQIPPGYEDAKGKEGIRKYGDLIIWKSLLDYAKESSCDIIFVCNDNKKDWIQQTGVEKGKPQPELLVEFLEETGRKILFYKPSSFIEKLKALYGKKPDELPLFDELDNVAYALGRLAHERQLIQSHSGDRIYLRCQSCGHEFSIWTDDLYLDWESSSYDDREMGEEIEWCSESSVDCPYCENEINLSFYAYEYPVGIFNEGHVESDGADLLNDPDIEKISPISDNFSSSDVCWKCGEEARVDDMGLCEGCRLEYEEYINSKD